MARYFWQNNLKGIVSPFLDGGISDDQSPAGSKEKKIEGKKERTPSMWWFRSQMTTPSQ